MRFTLCLFLSGCASWGYQAREDKRRVVELEKQIRELRTAQAKRSSPPAGEGKGEGDRSPAPPAAPVPPPAPPAPPVPVVTAAVPWSYPDQGTGFLGRPPSGWGASPLSLLVRNAATREIPGTNGHREHYCFLGVEIDEQPALFVRPDRVIGAVPLLWNVKEGPGHRTITLIPPGKHAYVSIDESGLHSFRFRCYVGPPKPLRLNDGSIMSVLQLYSQWERSFMNPGQITVDHWELEALIASGKID